MDLLTMSFDVKSAPVEMREQLAFAENELALAMEQLKKEPSVLENVILSTCNRTEIYAVVDEFRHGLDYLQHFLGHWFQLSMVEFTPYMKIYSGTIEVVEHLFRVTCGLESLIVGEEQILSQVKASFSFAQENSATGSIFNHLFNEAISLSKRAHTETALSRNSVSVGSASVRLAKERFFGSLSDKQVLIVGAGQMADLCAKYLAAQKLGGLTIVNRTFEKAQALADEYHGQAVKFDSLEEALLKADIVFSATAAKDFVLKSEQLRKIQEQRQFADLLLLDLAVPRDIEPLISTLAGVSLFDIDQVRSRVDENFAAREAAVQEVEILISADLTAFQTWINSQDIVPLIAELQGKAAAVQEKVMATIDHKLSDLTAHERKVVNKLTKSIVNQLLREPILRAKSIPAEEDSQQKLQLFKEIFGLEIEATQEEVIHSRHEKNGGLHKND